MPTDFQQHCNVIEECYEFTLSYAAQGHLADGNSTQERQLREHLKRAAEAMRRLEASCDAAIEQEQLKPAERYRAMLPVLASDARSSIAAVELVLAQPAISSQLIDNLNASIHLRALLTDIFLVVEILEAHQARAAAAQQQQTV
ncbi:MAG TPA: hypothetical protein VKU93_00240 [Terracidiphilus sp.]|jgi:hypothetical protein|nr:hypothetical protein [Terracidiphilus sp.]